MGDFLLAKAGYDTEGPARRDREPLLHDFGWAVEMMRRGYSVRRFSWEARGRHITNNNSAILDQGGVEYFLTAKDVLAYDWENGR